MIAKYRNTSTPVLMRLRKSKAFKGFMLFTAFDFLCMTFSPPTASALSGGPSQPEVAGFTPAGATNLVDPYTGDLNYSIPLMDVGGYPINLSYASGITPDQEATMTGLGWNLNIGAISRNLRGLPDEFKGDVVEREFSLKPVNNTSLTLGFGGEIFGFGNAALTAGADISVNYNNYSGISFASGANATLGLSSGNNGGSSGDNAKAPDAGIQESSTTGLGLGGNLQTGPDGVTFSPTVSLGTYSEDKNGAHFKTKASVGTSFNSRIGVTNMSIRGEQLGLAGSVSFLNNTYVPQIKFPRKANNYTFGFKTGGEIIGFNGTINVTGSFSTERLSEDGQTLPAYGYSHAEEGQKKSKVLLDFNREKDRPFSKNMNNLPLTNMTYDTYSVSGQGIGGSFRSYRSDIGYVFDNETESSTTGINIGLDLSLGNLAQGGFPLTYTDGQSRSGNWTDHNPMQDQIGFRADNNSAHPYEPHYYKMMGELTVDDENWIDKKPFGAGNLYFGGTQPMRVALDQQDEFTHIAENKFIRLDDQVSNVPLSAAERNTRQRRNSAIYSLDIDETTHFGVDPTYMNYTATAANGLPDYHPGEYTVLNADGSRYMFGLPAVNYKQKEVSFNISRDDDEASIPALAADAVSGLIAYAPGQDNSSDNDRGIDNMYDATTLPAYAHSYMLTSVLSDDYSDVDGIAGPSGGDLGTYTKFNYGVDYNGTPGPDVPNYKWRVPFEENKAHFNEGLKTLTTDDVANYTYGVKDLWYCNSIENKTHIAVFAYQERKDGYGVKNENGGMDANATSPMKKLVRIDLYALPEYEALAASASPIQSVHFVYDYSLCQNVPNNSGAAATGDHELSNDGGKLTLKKIFFTYENSNKHARSPYLFDYDNLNPNYGNKDYDVWGCYKPNSGSFDPNGGLINAEFPYVSQDKTTQNVRASAWCLSTIQTPAGGTINFEYEADDYAFVQNKKAMLMYNVIGAGTGTDYSSADSYLYDSNSGHDAHNYLFFDVPVGASVGEYCPFSDDDPIQFRFLLDLDGEGHYDYVEGYGLYEGCGIDPTDNTKGWMKLKNTGLGDRENNENGTVHPISKAGWNYGRLNNPRLVYGLEDPDDSGVDQVIAALFNANLLGAVIDLFNGVNRKFRGDDFSREFIAEKSWIRLNSPAKGKLGGNCRVKRVTLSDDWDYNTANQQLGFEYGQEYQYEMADGTSSGVASYEPSMSKENPLVQPVAFDEKRYLAPDEKHFFETPFGESFMPNPNVGYRRVTIQNLRRGNDLDLDGTLQDDELTVKRHATGRLEKLFYTAFDYPTIVNQTRLDVQRSPQLANVVSQLLNIWVVDNVTASQGYVIEKFDGIYGQPKAEFIYQEGKSTYISGIEYKYANETVQEPFQLGSNSGTRYVTRLKNSVDVLRPNGTLEEVDNVGVETDIVVDFRESTSRNVSVGGVGNLSAFLLIIFPGIVPMLIPNFSRSKNRFRSVVTTKVINRYPILREVVAHDLGASVTTSNQVWDSETGLVLQTKTTNEFNDNIYSFNYPAHWAYVGMGQAYRNIKQKIKISTDGNNFITSGSGLLPGDEIYRGDPGTSVRGYVIYADDVSLPSGPGHYIVGPTGFFSGNYVNLNQHTVTVIRSTRRNQQSMSMGSVVAKENPTADLNNDGVADLLDKPLVPTSIDVDVLQAQAIQFKESWRTECGYSNAAGAICDCYFSSKGFQLMLFLNDVFNTYNGNILTGFQGFVAGLPIEQLPTYTPDLHTTVDQQIAIVYPGSIGLDHYLFADAVTPDYIEIAFFPYVAGAPVDIDDQSCRIGLSALGLSAILQDPDVNNVALIDFRADLINCKAEGTLNEFLVDLSYTDGSNQQQLITLAGTIIPSITPQVPSWSLLNCFEIPANAVSCGIPVGDVVNPYTRNLRGVWRPKRNSLYLGARAQNPDALAGPGSGVSTEINTRVDGKFEEFYPFWAYSGSNSSWETDETEWTWAQETTNFSPYTPAVESRDALFRYSAKLFGYNHELPIAVASNATYNQIAFDGFEDYQYLDDCSSKHLEWQLLPAVDRTDNEQHTGRYSMQVAQFQSLDASTSLQGVPAAEISLAPLPMQAIHCLNGFAPQTYEVIGLDANGNDITANKTREYVVSFWIKDSNPADEPLLGYTSHAFSVAIDGVPLSPSQIVGSDVIEDWQRFEYLYEIPGGATGTLSMSLQNIGVGATNPNTNLYEPTDLFVDDLRIHPLNSSFKSFVFDPESLRLWAELDGNNFATLYEYDEEGKLARVKKETYRGFETLKEIRYSVVKKSAFNQ